MRLKSFYAKTMTEAMHMVRDVLGEDAVIVATREERGGKGVHVTAAIDPGYAPPAFEIGRGASVAPDAGWLQYDQEEDESAIAEELTDVMLRHGVTEDVMDQIISCAMVIGMERPAIALTAAIEHLFAFKPMPRKAARNPLMAVGVPGSGKTLVIAKLAARAAMDGLSACVITCDTVRAGGVEQLEAFTRLLKIPLHKTNNPAELKAMLADMRGRFDQILIDTPGVNPFAADDIKSTARLIGAADVDPFFVLAGGSDAEESGEMARAFSSIGVNMIVPTRVDMARRLGGILTAAHHGGMSFAEAGNTPKVADGLMTLSPEKIAALLMPAAFMRKAAPQDRTKTGTRQ